jgi:glycerol-3-phosphate acyltransferase PlsX
MGGDHAPQQTVLGALDAAADGIDVVLIGDAAALRAELSEHGGDLPVVHAPDVVGMAEDPAAAIRTKKEASVSVCARLVASGDAAGMVSAGSTGATMAAAAIVIGRVAGASRPAIATIFPVGHRSVVLDVGANLDVRPEHLAQFGIMGAQVARVYLNRPEPTVGVLNIGGESGKGRELEREAGDLLAASPLDFVGNVEGHDLGRGAADVFVTDGFTGNVLLKTAEGTARAVGRLVLETLAEASEGDAAVAAGAAALMPHLAALRNRVDPESFGGAHLIGTKGTVVIGHGNSSRLAVSNALRLAAEGADRGLVGKIEAALDE